MLGYHAHAVLSEQEKRNVRSFVDSVLSTLRDGLPVLSEQEKRLLISIVFLVHWVELFNYLLCHLSVCPVLSEIEKRRYW